MLLAVDVGNTHVTVGLFEKRKLTHQWRLAADPKKTEDEYGATLSSLCGRVGKVAVASVVPALTPVFLALSERYFGVEALWIRPTDPLGIPLRVHHPAEVGTDRLMNALAIRELYEVPAVVLDFGTATTFDCLSSQGEYLGGAILPGPRMLVETLARKTAQLPEVELRPSRRVIGKDTAECIQAGIFYGYLGMIREVLSRTLKEMPRRPAPGLYLTGGLSSVFDGHLGKGFQKVPDLTLQGIRLAFEKLSTSS
ncbi:MAG: type III pantothenate kinase [Elusimicrobia bacterium]|nr:type III pantothenate kinase [Elusimicrobiota bacterium]